MDVVVRTSGQGAYVAHVGGTAVEVAVARRDGAAARLTVSGRRVDVGFLVAADGEIRVDRDCHVVTWRNELAVADAAEEAGGGGRVTAPMHGALLEVCVAAGDRVAKGARLAVLEAMKTHHVLVAPIAGSIAAVHVTEGTQRGAADLILLIEADPQ